MSALTFSLKADVPERLDLSRLTPARLAGLDAKAIAGLAIGTTKAKLTAGDVFAISGDDPATLVFAGGSERFDNLGAGLTDGESITVEGDVGAAAGERMTGGTLRVAGSAGIRAGGGMTGGRLTIAGAAGDFLAAPRTGEMAGMAGGVIIVEGDIGARAGDRMKRGLIVVLGGTGEAPGSRMIGGTILAESFGPRAGYLMKRGTLIANRAEDLLATFIDSGQYQGTFLSLFQHWIAEAAPEAEDLIFGRARRWRGDMAELGKGELLLPV